jgi:hypothetical protein
MQVRLLCGHARAASWQHKDASSVKPELGQSWAPGIGAQHLQSNCSAARWAGKQTRSNGDGSRLRHDPTWLKYMQELCFQYPPELGWPRHTRLWRITCYMQRLQSAEDAGAEGGRAECGVNTLQVGLAQTVDAQLQPGHMHVLQCTALAGNTGQPPC